MGKLARIDGEIDTRPQQIDLLDPDKFPDRPELVALVQRRTFLPNPMPAKPARFTGKIVIERLKSDEDTAQAICLALVWGAPIISIARAFRMSTRSVLNVRAAMADRKELAHLKARAYQLLAEIAVVGSEVWLDGLVSGQIHPGQAQIPVIAAFDKLNQSHSMPEEGRQKTITLDPDALAELVAAARAQEGTVDAESSGSKRNALVVNASVVSDTLLDMAEGGVDGGVGVENGRADDGMEGGGDRVSGAGPDGRGDGSGKF